MEEVVPLGRVGVGAIDAAGNDTGTEGNTPPAAAAAATAAFFLFFRLFFLEGAAPANIAT